MADLDYSFAPAPHNMATDRDLSAEAFRLWSVIHLLKWNHIEPTPDALASDGRPQTQHHALAE
jgi:hypothetical protein